MDNSIAIYFEFIALFLILAGMGYMVANYNKVEKAPINPVRIKRKRK